MKNDILPAGFFPCSRPTASHRIVHISIKCVASHRHHHRMWCFFSFGRNKKVFHCCWWCGGEWNRQLQLLGSYVWSRLILTICAPLLALFLLSSLLFFCMHKLWSKIRNKKKTRIQDIFYSVLNMNIMYVCMHK